MKKYITCLFMLFFIQSVFAQAIEVIPLSLPFDGKDFRRCYGSVVINYARDMSNPQYEDEIVGCENKYTYSDTEVVENVPLNVLKEICAKNNCGENLQFENMLNQFKLKSKNISLYLWSSYLATNYRKRYLTVYNYKTGAFTTIPVIDYEYKVDKDGLIKNMIPKNDFDLFYMDNKLILKVFGYQQRKRVLKNKYRITETGVLIRI